MSLGLKVALWSLPKPLEITIKLFQWAKKFQLNFYPAQKTFSITQPIKIERKKFLIGTRNHSSINQSMFLDRDTNIIFYLLKNLDIHPSIRSISISTTGLFYQIINGNFQEHFQWNKCGSSFSLGKLNIWLMNATLWL